MNAPQLPLLFAHRGAPAAGTPGNTVDAFRHALSQGARALETDVWMTRDGVPVLHHPGLRTGPRRVGRIDRSDLPSGIATVQQLYAECGGDFDLSLDMASPRAVDQVVALAQTNDAANRLWLSYWRIPAMREWRRRWPEVNLVYPTILTPRRGIEVAASRLADAGIHAINLFHRQVSPRRVEIAHGHGLMVFAWGARHEPALLRALSSGVDGVFTDDLAALVKALQRPEANAP